nr:DUF6482 family protein [Alteromonas sp. 5E99-2]
MNRFILIAYLIRPEQRINIVKFFFSELINHTISIDLLEVHSFEMNVYLVSVTVGQQSGMVYGNNNRPKRFVSAEHIREAFEPVSIDKAVMVHDTPYDEMIGNPPKAKHSMALPFSMRQPY